MTDELSIQSILDKSDKELDRFAWTGTFENYLRLVTENPALCKLSHSLVYESILANGAETSSTGQPIYGLFENDIFGLEDALDKVVRYFAASAKRLEVRKRILLLIGPPAGGKSSIVDLIKSALEKYTRTDEGAVYAISECPMQEDPLHLVPEDLRQGMFEQFGIYIEGDLCPRCRYNLKSKYDGKASNMPVERVTFSAREAIGIGFYVATNPNPSDSSLLVGSIDNNQLEGHRLEVAGKSFRLDGELNVANRGLIEFVEMFKADRHQLNTLLGLAQEQTIKMDRFGSVYADEVIIGHSNEGDFDVFAADAHSEALRDRIIAVQIPYNLRFGEEIKIYEKMMRSSKLQDTHMPPLTLEVASIFSVLSRLDQPTKQGMSMIDKLRLYNGEMVPPYTNNTLRELRTNHPNEGMAGMSPRYVMNRIDTAASNPDINCIFPLVALDSLWKGLRENVSLDLQDMSKYVSFVADSVKLYNDIAVYQVQKAFEESFDQTAEILLESYLSSLSDIFNDPSETGNTQQIDTETEKDMREMEKAIDIAERNKNVFRSEIHQIITSWRQRGKSFNYTSEPRLKAAIEARLLPSRRKVERGLTEPRFAKQKINWARKRKSILERLVNSYGYCNHCSEDLINYVNHVLKNRPVLKTPRGESVEWLWDFNPN